MPPSVEFTGARPRSAGADAQLGVSHSVLDHGFVRLVDYMGGDDAVVQAARVSYGAGTKSVSEDATLIDYLMSHWHTTPFEMAEIKLHVKLPIFVARQWVRHRTASINEVSARYSVLDAEFYVPETEQIRTQSTMNKQGGGGVHPGADDIRQDIWAASNHSFDEYEALGRVDVARETARIPLPLGTYTQWYWKTNAHNLMNFLRLRADPHAQYEIRVYAERILEILAAWMPVTHAAFVEHRLAAVHLGATEVAVVQALVRGFNFEEACEKSGLEGRRKHALALALDFAR